MYAVSDLALVATYALLGVAWFRRFRSTKLGRNGTLLVLVGAGADLVENVLIGLGAPLGWLLLVATAVKWLTLLPAAVLALWTLRPSIARLPKAFYTHRYSAIIVLPLALLSLARGPDLLEQIPDIQRAWADPGQHWHFVWAGLAMGMLVVATLFIGRQRTGHLWLRTCPRWTGDQHPCADRRVPRPAQARARPGPEATAPAVVRRPGAARPGGGRARAGRLRHRADQAGGVLRTAARRRRHLALPPRPVG